MDHGRKLHHSPGECVEWASDSRLTARSIEPREAGGKPRSDEKGDMKVYAVLSPQGTIPERESDMYPYLVVTRAQTGLIMSITYRNIHHERLTRTCVRELVSTT